MQALLEHLLHMRSYVPRSKMDHNCVLGCMKSSISIVVGRESSWVIDDVYHPGDISRELGQFLFRVQCSGNVGLQLFLHLLESGDLKNIGVCKISTCGSSSCAKLILGIGQRLSIMLKEGWNLYESLDIFEDLISHIRISLIFNYKSLKTYHIIGYNFIKL